MPHEIQQGELQSPASGKETTHGRGQHMLGATQLEGSTEEKDVGVLVDTKSDMRQQCALATKKDNGLH